MAESRLMEIWSCSQLKDVREYLIFDSIHLNQIYKYQTLHYGQLRASRRKFTLDSLFRFWLLGSERISFCGRRGLPRSRPLPAPSDLVRQPQEGICWLSEGSDYQRSGYWHCGVCSWAELRCASWQILKYYLKKTHTIFSTFLFRFNTNIVSYNAW